MSTAKSEKFIRWVVILGYIAVCGLLWMMVVSG